MRFTVIVTKMQLCENALGFNCGFYCMITVIVILFLSDRLKIVSYVLRD